MFYEFKNKDGKKIRLNSQLLESMVEGKDLTCVMMSSGEYHLIPLPIDQIFDEFVKQEEEMQAKYNEMYNQPLAQEPPGYTIEDVAKELFGDDLPQHALDLIEAEKRVKARHQIPTTPPEA